MDMTEGKVSSRPNSYLNLKYEKLDVILNSEFLKYNFRHQLFMFWFK